MHLLHTFLWLVARIVPASARRRWLEEWRAEIEHGRHRMITGAWRDAWTMRRVATWSFPPEGGRNPSPFHALSQDFRYAFRSLLGSPGFVLGVVLSLAVGMTAMTSAFSFVNGVALRPPAGISQPDRVLRVQLERVINGFSYGYANYDAFGRLQKELRSFAGLAAYRSSDMAVGFPGEPIQVPGMLVSNNYFEVLGVRPAAGRLIGPAEEGPPGAHPVVVLSHDAWLRHYAGDDGVIGSTIKVNGRQLAIVGIAPIEFTGVRREIDESSGPDVWVPMSMSDLVLQDAQGAPVPIEKAPTATFNLVGRLAEGVTRAEAQAEAAVIAASIEWKEPVRLEPVANAGTPQLPTQAVLKTLNQAEGAAVELIAFMAVPLIVLALACVNGANLLAGRASRQLRDAAVRLSVGATSWRVVRQVLVESLLLALAGASLGLALTYWTIAAFESYFPIVLHIDWRVATFALVIAAFTALAFGLAPAVSTARRAADLVRGMSRRPGTRTRAALIAAQAALSLALIVTGWQFVTTVRGLAQNDGLQAANRLAVASIDVGKLSWQQSEVDVYYERVLDRVRQLPGLTHVALSCECNPWGGWNSDGGGRLRVWLPNHKPDAPGSTLAMYSGGDLLGALEMKVTAGRTFRPGEHRGPVRSIIVNQAFADRFLASRALGHALRVGATRDFSASHAAVVVGVVQPPSVARNDRQPMIYYPVPLGSITNRTLYVRFDRPAADSVPLLHAAIREIHADVPRPLISTAEEGRWQRNESNQFLAAAVSGLGVLALFLAGGGLYGVVAFIVSFRRQEIAIRMALGAQAGAVTLMVVRQVLSPAVLGAAVGALAAAATGMIVRSRLYGASPLDPGAFVGATSLLMLVLVVAAVIPASRAARVNPVDALRTE